MAVIVPRYGQLPVYVPFVEKPKFAYGVVEADQHIAPVAQGLLIPAGFAVPVVSTTEATAPVFVSMVMIFGVDELSNATSSAEVVIVMRVDTVVPSTMVV